MTSWPELTAEHPLSKLHAKLPEVLSASEGFNSIWGITLVPPTTAEGENAETTKPDFHTLLILQKFLRANAGDVTKAFEQLKDTMVWRKSFFGPGGEQAKGWDDNRFQGLGYVTTTTVEEGKPKKVISWNIYGAAKDIKVTFGNLEEFIRWRLSMMEVSMTHMALPSATEPIPDYEAGKTTVDPYQSIQVHDYLNVSFLRLPGEVKTCSKKAIEMLGRYYPETLERKIFCNVPTLMGWMYTLMKKFVASETMKKLEMVGDAKAVAGWIGEGVPEAYGGKGAPLVEVGETIESPVKIDTIPKKTEKTTETKAEEKTEEKKAEEEKSETTDKETPAAAETKEDAVPATAAEAPKAEEAKAEEAAKPADDLEKVVEAPKTGEAALIPENGATKSS